MRAAAFLLLAGCQAAAPAPPERVRYLRPARAPVPEAAEPVQG